MEKSFLNNTCPHCGFYKLKMWQDLSLDEKIIAEKVITPKDSVLDKQKATLICTRCWFEIDQNGSCVC